MPLDPERLKRQLQAAALALTLPASSLLIWGVLSHQRLVPRNKAEARQWVETWNLEGIFQLGKRARRGDAHALRQLTALAQFAGEGDGMAVGLELIAIARFQPQRLLGHLATLPPGEKRNQVLRILLHGAMESGPEPSQLIASLRPQASTPAERRIVDDLRAQHREIER